MGKLGSVGISFGINRKLIGLEGLSKGFKGMSNDV